MAGRMPYIVASFPYFTPPSSSDSLWRPPAVLLSGREGMEGRDYTQVLQFCWKGKRRSVGCGCPLPTAACDSWGGYPTYPSPSFLLWRRRKDSISILHPSGRHGSATCLHGV